MTKSQDELNQIKYSDESILCAERFWIKFIRRYENEVLNEEYYDLIKPWMGNMRLHVWALIDYKGPYIFNNIYQEFNIFLKE